MKNLAQRIEKLEMVMRQEQPLKKADLSSCTLEELNVLERLYDYTVAREVANPTGKRPLQADPSGLSDKDMAIYRRMEARETAKRAECRQ
jgi:hypothetical protein